MGLLDRLFRRKKKEKESKSEEEKKKEEIPVLKEDTIDLGWYWSEQKKE